MLASPAYAAAGASATGTGATVMAYAPFVLIIIIFYFLMIRPQQRRMKQHQAMLGAVKKNDVVITNGGLIGKATKVDDNEVELEIAPGVRVKVVKTMISDVRPFGAKPAND
jgi:preprotein translocase subunit YajC